MSIDSEMVAGSLAAAFLIGLLGGVHCVGMCGGIVGTLTAGLPRDARASFTRIVPYQLAYNGGRIAGYTFAGALMGALGTLVVEGIPLHSAQRALYATAAIVMVLLGLHLGGWWHALERLERLGGFLWRRLEPLGRRLLPVRNPIQAIGLGFLWAWIPCGLVYSVLVWSVTSGNAIEGAMLMLAFGLGTVPNLLTMGLLAGAAARVSAESWVRQAAGGLVIGFGLYALWQLSP